MPGTWPLAEYTLAAIALIAISYVAIAALKRRNGKKADPPGDDPGRVVQNNTHAMEDLTELIRDLRDVILQTSARQDAKLDELVAHARRES